MLQLVGIIDNRGGGGEWTGNVGIRNIEIIASGCTVRATRTLRVKYELDTYTIV